MKLSTFPGGIKVASHKQKAKKAHIVAMPLAKKLIIPLAQHAGSIAVETVKKQEQVRKGQLIGKAGGFISANIHASTSGAVKDISSYPHPVLGAAKAVVIEPDGKDGPLTPSTPPTDIRRLASPQIKESVFEAGIVGLGGAAFPSHVKLSVPKGKNIDTVIINGAECEPYLSCDHRAMCEFPEEIAQGAFLIAKALGVNTVFVGIEDDKPDAIQNMREAIAKNGFDFRIAVVKKKYPQGGEKQLIKSVLKREIPPAGLPMDVGVVVFNVGTARAVYHACAFKTPLYERVLTVSGDCVKEPMNVLVRIGTSIRDAIEFCGGFTQEPEKIIMGGPLMGITQSDLDTPVIKGTSGILCISGKKLDKRPQRACFRCGRCVEACPVRMLPYQLSVMIENGAIDHTREYNILDCIECGSCSYVCPAKRDIVGMVKYAKAKLRQKTAR